MKPEIEQAVFLAVLFSNPPILAFLVRKWLPGLELPSLGTSRRDVEHFKVSEWVPSWELPGCIFFLESAMDGLWNWDFVEEKTWVEGCVVFLLKVCHLPHGLSICRPQELDTLLAGSPLRNMSGCHHFLNEAKNPDIKVCGDQGLRCVSFRIWGGGTTESWFLPLLFFLFVLLRSYFLQDQVEQEFHDLQASRGLRNACFFFFFFGNTKSFIIGNRMSVRSHKLWRTWSGIYWYIIYCMNMI